VHPEAGFAGVPQAASGPPVTKVVKLEASPEKLKKKMEIAARVGVKEGVGRHGR